MTNDVIADEAAQEAVRHFDKLEFGYDRMRFRLWLSKLVRAALAKQEQQSHIFKSLRAANVARQKAWCPDEQPDLSFRGNELSGETGEACNVIKKLERERHGWKGSRDTKEHLAEELADIVITTDLTAIAAGIDLEKAIVEKFNATSEKHGFPQRIVFEQEQQQGEKWTYVPVSVDEHVSHYNVTTQSGRLIYEGATSEKLVIKLIDEHNASLVSSEQEHFEFKEDGKVQWKAVNHGSSKS